MANHHRNRQSRPRRSRSFAVDGNLLRACRVASGWTQEDAAAKAGVSDRLVRKAESGGPLEIQSIAILAQLYSTTNRCLTPDDLLAESVAAPSGNWASSPASRAEALVRRFFDELWNQRRFEAIDELLSPDCVLHAEGRELRGRTATYRRAEELFAAFGEFAIDIQDLSSHDDLVVCRWRLRMMQTAIWCGCLPTGQRRIVHGSSWIRVESAWLIEGWDYWHEPLYGVVERG
jgi:transcriptional regulator with XRE-family HTH domain